MLALVALLPLLAASTNAWSFDNHTCALTPPMYSCENTTTIVNTCCTPVQGLVLTTQVSAAQAQMSNYSALTAVLEHCEWFRVPQAGRGLTEQYTGNEASGSVLPKESWGIHGLWPDHCDGTYGA